MTRHEFIETKWLPYPQPTSQLYQDQDWIFGKVTQVFDDKRICLDDQNLIVHPGANLRHPELGFPVPEATFLRCGDSVAIFRPQSLCYLLSPQLSSTEWEAGQEGLSWQKFLATVRLFFEDQGFRHWKTATLLMSSGIDAHIDFMKVKGVRTQRNYFLPTSPEFELKKAMALGEKKIFEIKSCFRDDDSGVHHRAEFTMVEWYRAYADKWQLVSDFKNLLAVLIAESPHLQGAGEFSQVSLRSLFAKHVHTELTPQTSRKDLTAAIQRHNLDFANDDDWDDLFFRLYLHLIEPHLGQKGPQVVYDFPVSQGSLSRTNSEGWADRFEIYWQGVELANAYQEQNNPQEIDRRYQSEVQRRQSLGRESHSVDQDFLEKMKMGFPPSAGIALGLDRLWMVLNKKNKLS